jgi:hypothetical protein
VPIALLGPWNYAWKCLVAWACGINISIPAAGVTVL